MEAKTRTRGAGGWVAFALLSPLTMTIDVAMTAKSYASPGALIGTVTGALVPDWGGDESDIPEGCACEHPEPKKKK